MVRRSPGWITVSPVGSDRLRASFMFTADPPARRMDANALRAWVRARFAGARWETSRLLEGMEAADDLYVDSLATVHVDRYSRGRIAQRQSNQRFQAKNAACATLRNLAQRLFHDFQQICDTSYSFAKVQWQ